MKRSLRLAALVLFQFTSAANAATLDRLRAFVRETQTARAQFTQSVVDKNGRRGSVDHSFEASLSGSGGLEAGDLLLTPPTIGEQKGVRLTAEPIVEGRALDAYVEIYGAGRPEGTKVTIEVADTDTSPVLTTVDAPVSEGRDKSRLVAEAPLPLGRLRR